MTTLAKAKIVRVTRPSRPGVPTSLSVQFNPQELNFTKTAQYAEIPVPGLDTPLLQYVRGAAETMSLELFFDSTEDGTGAQAKPVTALTDRFYALIKADPDTHAPAILLFLWGGTAFPGQRRDNGFRCVCTGVRQQFTLFAPDGKPLRAKLTVDLKEYKELTPHLEELGFHSADHTRAAVVRAGDTITSITARVYGTPVDWRRIAVENGITDPFALADGQILRIPTGAGR